MKQSPRAGLDDAGLREWISVETYHAIIKELPSIIHRLTDILIVISREQIVADRAIGEGIETTLGKSLEA